VVVDVTDEVRAREGLSRTVEYNERFTAILGHDLRNPLNAITTTAQLLQRRATTDEIAKPAARIVASGDRMLRMINQLLDLARVRVTGGLRLSPKPLDLAELCRHVLDELRVAHPGSSLELVTDGSLVGRWDGDRLAQVLSNLAANALEHGVSSAPVRVRLDGRDPERVGIRVENQGAIPEPLLPLLFDPFRSAEQRSAKARGLGLGLYISHEIIAAHRGKMTVRSSSEEGTCFEVELPKSEELTP
jgi:signal transduction histidine kinase